MSQSKSLERPKSESLKIKRTWNEMKEIKGILKNKLTKNANNSLPGPGRFILGLGSMHQNNISLNSNLMSNLDNESCYNLCN